MTEQDTGHVVAALLTPDDAETFLRTGELPGSVETTGLGPGVLYRYPWDVLAMVSEAIVEDIGSVRMVDTKVTGSLAKICWVP